MTKKEKLFNWAVKHIFSIALTISIIIILLSTLTIFIRNGNIYADDIVFHTNRILGIAEGLKGGQFPVKYYPNWYNGAGYFSPLFYGELFLYFPAILVLIGVPIKVSYYIFIFTILFAIYISFYFLVKKFTQNKIWCVIGATTFVLSQYIFLDIFYRGAIGEITAIIFIIWLFIGIYNLLKENYSKPYILSIAMLGLLFSHMTSLIFGVVFLVIVVLFNAKTLFKQKSFWIKSLIAFAIFIVIGAYQLFSFIEMYFSDTYVVSHPWATPSNYAHDFYDMFFDNICGIGFVALIPFILRLFVRKTPENEKEVKTINMFLIISSVFLFLSSSFFPWKNVQHLVMFIQFPWRLHVFSTIMLVLALILELKILYNKRKIVPIILVSLLAITLPIYNNLRLFYEADYYFDRPPTNIYEWLPEELHNVITWPRETIITNEQGEEITYTCEDNKIDITFNSTQDSTFYSTYVVYYKGYVAEITLSDGSTKPLEIHKSDEGTIVIETNGLVGDVNLRYKGTTVQNLSLTVSILGILGTIITPIILHYKKKKSNTLNFS